MRYEAYLFQTAVNALFMTVTSAFDEPIVMKHEQILRDHGR